MIGPAGGADLPALPAGCALTVGVFDGVHRGHQELVGRTVRAARRRGVPSVAVTFSPHPRRTLRPGAEPALLTALDHRVRLLEAYGIDRVVVLRFDDALAALSASVFVEDLLVAGFRARHIVVGSGFRFGRGGLGDVALLTDLGLRWGFEVDEVAAVSGSGGVVHAPDFPVAGSNDVPATQARVSLDRVSSTQVRRLVASGRVAEAAALLGRPHRLTGHVSRVLAAPRAGEPDVVLVEPVSGMVVPARGRYAGSLHSPSSSAVQLVVPSAGSGTEECALRVLGPAHPAPGQRVEVDVHRVLSPAARAGRAGAVVRAAGCPS